MPALVQALSSSERAVTQLLWAEYHPQYFFYGCIGIGLLSTLAMIGYHFWLEAGKKRDSQAAT
jgi:hypothetical protein